MIKDKTTLEEQLKKGAQYQTTDMAGIVSYRVDGLEEKLKTEQMDQFSEKFLNDYKISALAGAFGGYLVLAIITAVMNKITKKLEKEEI